VNALVNLAQLLPQIGEPEQARRCGEEGYAMSREVHGDDALDTAWAASALCDIRRAEGRLEEAERLAREAVRIQKLREDPANPESGFVAQALYALAKVLSDRGDAQGAAVVLRATLVRYEAQFGESHAYVNITRARLAEALADGGCLAEAEAEARRTLAAKAMRNPCAAEAHVVLARCAAVEGDPELARRHFDEALRIRDELNAHSSRTPLDLRAYADFLLERGEVGLARAMLERALDEASRRLAAEDPVVRSLRDRLARCGAPGE
jgi:tetratricopeptide (TPR) repeat protein